MKRFLACALSIAVGGGFFAACGASARSVCEKTCDCVGCSDAELEDCVDTIEDSEREADAEGCSQEYANALDCYAEEMECESSGQIEVTGCDAVIEDLADCMGESVLIGGSECESACEASRQCPGADPSTDCATLCADAIADAASLECSGEYELLIECAASVPDICDPGDACGAESSTFYDCYVNACTENPDQPACT